MSWKVALPLGFLVSGAIVAGLVEMERRAPFVSKPSILLRASTGDPALELPAKVEAVEAAAAEARQAIDAASREAQISREVLHFSRGIHLALTNRIQEKQAGEWANTQTTP